MASHTKKEETGRPEKISALLRNVLFSRRSAALCTALGAGLPAQASLSVFTFPDRSSGISKTGSSITAAAPRGICTPLPCSAASRRHLKSLFSCCDRISQNSPAVKGGAPPRRAAKRRAGENACPPFVFLSERQRIYLSTFSMKRLSIAAACARVASPRGSRRPLSSPRRRPAPTAQFIAGTA